MIIQQNKDILKAKTLRKMATITRLKTNAKTDSEFDGYVIKMLILSSKH